VERGRLQGDQVVAAGETNDSGGADGFSWMKEREEFNVVRDYLFLDGQLTLKLKF